MTKEDLFNQGMDLLADDKTEEAMEAYKKALEVDPNYAEALHALAMCYANLDRLDEAIEVGKKLIQVSPDDELAHTSLSNFLSAQRDDSGGRGSWGQGQNPGLEERASGEKEGRGVSRLVRSLV